MNEILSVNNLNKFYGSKQVLKNVNFQIFPGQIVGLLGPNGSGKTTIIKIINGFLTDYSGNVLVCNKKLGIESKEHISFMPDNSYLRADLKLINYIDLYNDMFKDFNRAKSLEMIKALKLDENVLIRTLSKGMCEKFQLILTMARKANLYIFDEPIAAVDPASREFILNTIIKNYSEDGAMLLSTHLITDVEHVFNRALFIKEGNLYIDKDADELREERKMSIDQIFREEFRC